LEAVAPMAVVKPLILAIPRFMEESVVNRF